MRRRVEDVMTTGVMVVGEQASFKAIVGMLEECHISAVPVVDDHGDIIGKTLARLFPAAPDEGDPWQVLLWSTGRIELPGHGRLAEWRWQADVPPDRRPSSSRKANDDRRARSQALLTELERGHPHHPTGCR